ncbi:MAG: hypothetical protein ILA25_02925 [Prevotella sp.]|nr:hypothetical protein [Prevotella sp.]
MISYFISGLLTVSGGIFIYEVIANSDWTFAPQWNIFRSPLLVPLYIIGIIVMFAYWSKFSFSQDTYIKTTYRDGSSKTEKSYDISDVLFGHLILPLIGRFVIVPLMVSAVIYYPLMCVVWLVGGIFPYVLALIVLAIIVFSWTAYRHLTTGNQALVSGAVGIVFTLGFAFGSYVIEQGVPSTVVQQTFSSQNTTGSDDIEELEEINEDEFE